MDIRLYYELSFKEASWITSGYNDKLKREQAQSHEIAMVNRYLATIFVNMQSKKRYKPKDLLTFWDETTTEEDLMEQRKIIEIEYSKVKNNRIWG